MGDFQKAFGQYISDYRKARHIRIADLAPGRETTLSRFLKHGNKVSVQLITEAMRRMGLQYTDLANDFPRFNAPFTSAADALMAVRYAADSTEVAAIVEQYLAATESATGPIAALNRQVFDYIKSVSEARRMSLLSEPIQVAIEQTLLANSDWLMYDYLLLRLVMGYLDDDRLARCYRLFHQRSLDTAPGYRHYANDVMLQFGIVLIVRGSVAQFPDYCREFQTLWVQGYNFQDSLVFNAVRQLLQGQLDGTEDAAPLADVFAATTTLQLPQVEGYLRRLLAAANGEVKGVFL
ncbi:hypothetical protein [Lacticaseibacillus suihuaensis]